MNGSSILVVVGLGNPGPDYAGNRHNVGQMVLDELASRMGATFKKHKTPNQVAEGRLVPGGTRLVLAKPGSFMNTSGGPVSSVLGFYSATPADLVVVHDELDLPFDTVRLKGNGGHGGHNGLRDIIKATGTNEFMRVRVGIGRPPGRQDPADYVLRDFSAAEKKTLPILLADAADAVEAIAEVGLLAAQQRVHAPS
ncbi:aminoacyl-tRNA hydrolase [Curtobacterium flaccumfaciens]|jgi:PTH1 family peptidyl-tRNA hydrolase|uniref:aminoacyl-tRNA hydrolase n=1 Tax=Curtobacterium flaccumfaciens TaxID=2035 RepID=UPI001BDDDFB2|nr:aminoacyl-tRNA hydrolase [Curtobacterium flaccumfaciens]MBT1606580.1 aminoacyl-tRNA hydrolase [Curtobacterium flaccumfaciens pv. betae]MBT1658046.1 aminoacyl-tRNA hydrolase [Curtobacterium flaccumfaciens pv. betae]MCS0471374.1 aminoacyl-tRNA hydrolase [Curtobacterium flaccumfaciens pv. betae]MCS0476037.1 aminoacyl-tRNA hydrolase [Curtobacterium flaccumfaciens pv. betae]MCS0477495.1 aminoacyl-tRNA hydrolase [Curtobacterium flaccumfaciens pv. betae]